MLMSIRTSIGPKVAIWQLLNHLGNVISDEAKAISKQFPCLILCRYLPTCLPHPYSSPGILRGLNTIWKSISLRANVNSLTTSFRICLLVSLRESSKTTDAKRCFDSVRPKKRDLTKQTVVQNRKVQLYFLRDSHVSVPMIVDKINS